MNMDVTSGIKARVASALCSSLVVLAAVSLSACGGGGGDAPAASGTNGTLTTSISAVPTAMSPASGEAPLAVTFMAMEPKGNIANFQWDFKDNSAVKMGQSVEHTFMEPGSYGVTLTVTDAAGNFNRATVMVSVADGGTCTQVPAQFSSIVWPAMSAGSSSCLSCHASGLPAGGTGLVFVRGGTELQNYNILRSYARTSSDTLLAKVIGGLNHTGGKPFVDANSTPYKALAELVPEMKQACTSAPPAMAQFWQGVSFSDDQKVLAKASMIFASRNPTAAESSAVMSGGAPVLRQTIRSYMTGPEFDRFLEEAGDTWFLTRGVTVFGNNVGLNATDLPSAADVINNQNLANGVRNRFTAAMQREPIELMKYIVNNDKSWTDMVAGNYTVVNGLVAQYLAARVTGTFTAADPIADATSDMQYLPAVLPNQRLAGDREHAGVLSTHAWLMRFPTTPTNRNRHRVYQLSKQFLATDVAALAARPIDDGGNFKIPTMENAACAVCHQVIDPIAAGWQNWQENNRYLPFRDSTGKDHALPGSYRSNNYPKDKDGKAYYQLGDNWFRDEHAPGYGSTPMPGGVTGNKTALQWMGGQVATDARFAKGAVHFWFRALFNREPLKAPTDETAPGYQNQLAAYNAQNEEFKAIAERFATNRGNGAYNVKDLLVDLVTSQWFRAEKASGLTIARAIELQDVGSQAMLNPAALQRKLLALTGVTWNQFNNPYAGQALNYGNFDGGLNRMVRANEYTMVQTMIADRMMGELSCRIVQTDFNKPVANRLMFAGVTLNDTPATAAGDAAIQQTVKNLHKWLWKDDVAVTDAEVQRTVALFKAVWADRATAPARPTTCAYNNTNDPNYTGRAWAAVIGYMIGDQKMLFE